MAVAKRNGHRLPRGGPGRDDLFQECRLAVWQAASRYDGRIPWHLYAAMVARRAANRFIKVVRRGGLTFVGDVRGGRTAPRTAHLDDAGWRLSMPAVVDSPEETLEEMFARIESLGWLPPRVVEAVGLILLEGMSQSDVARRWGVKRQAVGEMLGPLRDYLRGLT